MLKNLKINYAIDLKKAMTLDVLNKKNIQWRRYNSQLTFFKVLKNMTAKLPLVEFKKQKIIGNTTASAIHSPF